MVHSSIVWLDTIFATNDNAFEFIHNNIAGIKEECYWHPRPECANSWWKPRPRPSSWIVGGILLGMNVFLGHWVIIVWLSSEHPCSNTIQRVCLSLSGYKLNDACFQTPKVSDVSCRFSGQKPFLLQSIYIKGQMGNIFLVESAKKVNVLG